ncbi:ATP-grasp domain-containing protein [Candidatus Bathyarchaeota archaeon]|nr:ATP-grasp domain-containing protein [Candidatus Bathyarchaeota archaeon]
MPLKVCITYNLRRPAASDLPEDYYVEYDEEETVEAIAKALEKSGCSVVKIEADEDSYLRLRSEKPDIVFNIAEGLRGESRESHIPSILEMLGIPYTGSGPATLAICLDKALTHQVLSSYGLPSPKFQVFESVEEKLEDYLEFPLIVKPLREGSSKGIRSTSLVRDAEALRKQVSWVISTYKQPAIVEEFLPGREFTIGILGNRSPVVLPIVEILLDKLPREASPIYSYEAKWLWDTPNNPLDILRCPADIPLSLESKLKDIALKTFRVLGCRDLCRIDVRLDRYGEPRIMEVNPLPGLIPNPDAHSALPTAARAAGYSYDELICTILWYALERYGMEDKLDNRSLVKLPRPI